MELIVTERSRTHTAFLQGEEWTEYGTLESSLTTLVLYLAHTLNDSGGRAFVREKENKIIIDFVNTSGIVTRQLEICHNVDRRDMIISELGKFCQIAPMGT